MTPREAREFLRKVGEDGLRAMNAELHTESWNVDRWSNDITEPAVERRFCDYWRLPTEADKTAMVGAATLWYQKRSFYISVTAAALGLATLIVALITLVVTIYFAR